MTRQLLGVVQSSIILLEIRFGLGFHVVDLTRHDADILRLLVWVATIFWILAIACSMLSTCLLIVRIVRVRQQCVVAYSAIAVISLWALGFVFVNVFRCPLPSPWETDPKRCLNQVWQLHGTAGRRA